MKLDTYFRVIEFHLLVRVYMLTDWAMGAECQEIHSFAQNIWMKSWVGGRTIFWYGCARAKDVGKCGEKPTLEDLHGENDHKWK